MTMTALPKRTLVDQLQLGLNSPICLTWELTYGCNFQCIHCLSSSGRRDPKELDTAECKAFVDELRAMQVFYVNIGGGEPTLRSDFFEIVEYCTTHNVGVKFSTNGSRISPEIARRLVGMDYLDVQVSLDGATEQANDAVRGPGTYRIARQAMENLRNAGFAGFKLSVVITRDNVEQLDALKKLADDHHAQLRLTRLRPSGRAADHWDELHPTSDQQRKLHHWLLAHATEVLTGDSFFHLAGFGQALPGLNLCGAGKVVCLVDPVGSVYACPFTIHEQFLAGNIRSEGGFRHIWENAKLFRELREPSGGGACQMCGAYDACRGGCTAAKFFTGAEMDGPDPECVLGNGTLDLGMRDKPIPVPSPDHSSRVRVPVTLRGHSVVG